MKKQYNINLDRLEITYDRNEDLITYLSDKDKVKYEGFFLQREENTRYENEFSVWCDDYEENRGKFTRLVGYLYYGSFNVNRQHIYFSYHNEALYNWIIHTREYIEGKLSLNFLRISKIDIAVDFNFNIQTFLMRAYKDLDYKVIVCGEEMSDDEVFGVGVYAGNNPRRRLFAHPELIIFNKNKTMTLKNYNKTREIEQSSGKYYIAENSGFKRNYRVEVCLKNHKVLLPSIEATGLSEVEVWERIMDKEIQLQLFKNTIDRLIRFKKGRKSYSLFELALKDVE